MSGRPGRPEYSSSTDDFVWTRNGWTRKGSRDRQRQRPFQPENDHQPLPTTSTIVQQGERTLRITLGGEQPLVEDITPRKK